MDACPNCGYCKHCGRSDAPAVRRAPMPVFPMTPSPIVPLPCDPGTAVDPWGGPTVRPRVWRSERTPSDHRITVTWGPPPGAEVTRYADGVYSWQ